MALPSLGSLTTSSDDSSKKIRKPYTITKSRESWTEQEHDKFLEALQLSQVCKLIIKMLSALQIRSHAQKYFLKVQKNGTSEHVPPPRPKRKAAHPYPQKASKNVSVPPQAHVIFPPSTSCRLESGYSHRTDSSSLLRNSTTTGAVSSWAHPTVSPLSVPNAPKVMPDFSQVYSFIGSVFDPNTTGHLQKLKAMDPIDVETVLQLMRNLSVNLSSPEFEDHRKLLSSYDVDTEEAGPVSAKHSDKTGDGTIKVSSIPLVIL
ncbi:hypothetical protein AMTRI_Chr09g16120 [Amborella trichopoda]